MGGRYGKQYMNIYIWRCLVCFRKGTAAKSVSSPGVPGDAPGDVCLIPGRPRGCSRGCCLMTWHYFPNALRCVPGKKSLRWGVVFPARKQTCAPLRRNACFFCLQKWLPEDSAKDDKGNELHSLCLCKVLNLPREITLFVNVPSGSCSTSFALYIKRTRFRYKCHVLSFPCHAKRIDARGIQACSCTLALALSWARGGHGWSWP